MHLATDPITHLREKRRLIQDQIQAIDRELTERHRLHERRHSELERQLASYRAARTQPQELRELAGTLDFPAAKAFVDRLIRQTRQQIAAEETAHWNDIQTLLQEKRRLAREKAELELTLRSSTNRHPDSA